MSVLKCRSCRKEDAQDNLMSPCDCEGNQHFIHKQCLSNVIRNFGAEKCPICRSPYRSIKVGQGLQKFSNYLSENQYLRLRGLISTSIFISIGFYTILLGLAQCLQSTGIIKVSWLVILGLLVVVYFHALLFLTVYAIIELRKNFVKWQSLNPLITITQIGPK